MAGNGCHFSPQTLTLGIESVCFFGNPIVFGALGVFINTDFVPGVSI